MKRKALAVVLVLLALSSGWTQEAQRQRELKAAQALAAEQKRRAEEQAESAGRLSRRARLLAGAMVVAVILAAVALLAFRRANQSANAAQVASTQAVSERYAAETAEAQEADQRAKAEAEGWARATLQAVAEAERLQRLKDVEINAQRELVKLYDQAPVLVELEKLRMQLAHNEKIATLQMESYLKAFEALAPSTQIRIYGGGNQTTQIITELMSFAQGIQYLGEEVPLVGRMLGPSDGGESGTLLPRLAQFFPYLQQALGDINPRLFSSLKLADLIERLTPVVAGREDLVTALTNIKEDATFRVVGDLPIAPLFRLLGIELPKPGEEVIPLDEEPLAAEAQVAADDGKEQELPIP